MFSATHHAIFFSPRVSEIDDHQENGYCPAAAPLHLKEVGDGAKRHRRGLFPPQFAIVRPRVSSRRTPRGQSSRSPTPARPAPPPTSAPPPPGTRGRAPPSTTRASSCGAPREARLTTGPPVPGGGTPAAAEQLSKTKRKLNMMGNLRSVCVAMRGPASVLVHHWHHHPQFTVFFWRFIGESMIRPNI